jgi:glycosyltransferase involved in cell wall biosynthesis
MHVLQCYKTALPLSMGGAEQVMHHIAQGILAHGFQSTVVTFAPQKNIEEFEYQGYRVVVVPSDVEYASTPISLKGLGKFKELSEKADIIHYHYPYPWMDIMHFCAGHTKPTLLTYHSDIVKQKYLSKIYNPIKKRFLNQMDAIVATSPQYMRTSVDLQGFKHKTHCIPLGLDESQYFPISEQHVEHWRSQLPERFLLFIGVFRYYKGLNYLFEALKGLDIPLVLIGDGPEKAHLQALETQYQLKNIHYLGKLQDQDKNAVLQLSGGLVLPSHLRSEAFGLSLVEGAMFGKPLISCEMGTGTSYINQDLQTGWVVPPADANALRLAIQAWYTKLEFAQSLGENARQHYAQLFKASQMVEQYVKLYRDIKNI